MTDNSKYFEKYVLNNNVEVPGRLVIPPLTLFSSNPDGSVSDEERKYLELRATGVGLYILGACAVSQEGIAFLTQPRSLSEKDIEPNAERAKIIKSQGALAINQIHHGGALARKEYSGLSPVAPSAEIANQELQKRKEVTEENKIRELTDEEIKKIINKFVFAKE